MVARVYVLAKRWVNSRRIVLNFQLWRITARRLAHHHAVVSTAAPVAPVNLPVADAGIAAVVRRRFPEGAVLIERQVVRFRLAWALASNPKPNEAT